MSGSNADELEPSPSPGTGDSVAKQLGRYIHQAEGGARDGLLRRQIACERVDASQADDLLERARFLSRLRHPGLGVVHDYVRSDTGALLISEPLPGETLATALAGTAIPHPRLATPADVVLLFIKLGDAISAAHAQGVVHRALDARCVHIGVYGETAISNWGPAMASLAQPLTLRFVGNRPPGPALDLDDCHTDICALGRMLLAALARRPDGPAVLEPLTPHERERTPAQIERIARHAATSSAASGYPTVEEFVIDLRLALDGELPVVPVSRGERVSWWLSQHRRAMGFAAVALAAVVLAWWLLTGQSWMESRRWTVVTDERFVDEGWRKRWMEKKDHSFDSRNGALVSTATREAVLIFRRRLLTPVVVEYDGRVEPGSQACDLSLLWSEGDRVPERPESALDGRCVQLQLGAFDNSYSAIIANPGAQRLAHSSWRLESGRTYRIRAEIDGERYAMYVDGLLLLEGRALLPSLSGYVSLYSYYPGKSFGNLRILQPRQAEEGSTLAGGNAVFQIKMYREAALFYGAVAEAHVGTVLGDEAAYRRGLCERMDGRMDEARKSWAGLSDPFWSGLAECHVLEDLCATWQHARYFPRFEELYRERAALRYQLRLTWQSCLRRVLGDLRRDIPTVDAFLAQRSALFPDDSSSRYVAAEAYVRTARMERVINEFPEEQRFVAIAMLALGMSRELADAPWSLPDERYGALCMRGEYEEALRLPRISEEQRGILLFKMGRMTEALALAPDSLKVLLLADRSADIFGKLTLSAATANEALLASGRWQEAAGAGLPGVDGSGGDSRALAMLGRLDEAHKAANRQMLAPCWDLIAAIRAGDRDRIQTLIAALPKITNRSHPANQFTRAVVLPMALRELGDATEPQRSWREGLDSWRWIHGQRIWRLLSTVLDEGHGLDELPARSETHAWQLVGSGLRAELQGEFAKARESYAAFVALPITQRLLGEHLPDQEVEAFVAWRLAALGGR